MLRQTTLSNQRQACVNNEASHTSEECSGKKMVFQIHFMITYKKKAQSRGNHYCCYYCGKKKQRVYTNNNAIQLRFFTFPRRDSPTSA